MEFREVNEDSKYFFFLADNESQFCDMGTAWEELGGTKFVAHELQHVLKNDTEAVLVEAVFVVSPPRPNAIRCFIGHGVSDKPIAEFKPPQNMFAMDYYFSAGPKQAWNFDYYKHSMVVPYNREIRIGMPSSDFFINGLNSFEWREETKKRYGIDTGRKIVLFSPTFQSKSLEFYYRLLVESFKDEYFLIVRRHDREAFFSPHRFPHVLEYRGLNHPNDLIGISDLYIGDGSSVDNLAVFAGIPIVEVRPLTEIWGAVPYEYDLRNYVPYFSVDPMIKEPTILDVVKDAFDNFESKWNPLRKKYIEKSFYFNDGKCMDRFTSRLKDLLVILKMRKNGHIDRRYMAVRKIWEKFMESQGIKDHSEKPKNPFEIDFDKFDF